MLRRRSLCLAVLLSCPALVLSSEEVPVEKKAGMLVRVVTNDSKPIIGVLKEETEAKIELVELTTGQTKAIPTDQLESVRRNLTENEAAQTLGLGTVLAWKILGMIPNESPTGRIVKVDQATMYVSLGSKAGIKAGHELRVYRGKTELKDPTTGDVLGHEKKLIGRLVVTEVRDNFSKARTQSELEIRLEVGDTVEPATVNNLLVVLPLVTVNGEITELGAEVAEQLTTALVQRNCESHPAVATRQSAQRIGDSKHRCL